MSKYVVTAYHPQYSYPITTFDAYISLQATRVVGGVGALTLTLLYEDRYLDLPLDTRLILTKQDGQHVHLFGAYLLRGLRASYEAGRMTLALYGLCYNSLLMRRIVMYPAGSVQSFKSGAWDNVLRAFVRENAGSLAAPERQISILNVEDDLSIGATVTISAAYRNLYDVARMIESSARQAGDVAVWDVVPSADGTSGALTVRKDYLVADRRITSSVPLLLSPQLGSVSRAIYTLDRREEYNVVHAGGQGEGSERVTVTVSDTARIGDSPINRAEVFYDGRHLEDTSALTDAANTRLAEGLPRMTLDVQMDDASHAVYGVDYQVGDLVTLHWIRDWDLFVRSVEVSVNADQQRLKANLEVVT